MNAFPPIEIFVSYVQEDKIFFTQLKKHLSILQRQGFIVIWHEQLISAGSERTPTIDAHLLNAKIILVLVSSNYFSSDFQHEYVLHHVFEHYNAQSPRVIPILIRPSLWQLHPLSKFQVLPHNTRPIAAWSNRDAAWMDVVEGIHSVVMELSPYPGLRLPVNTVPIWTVPHARNYFFTGREAFLSKLETLLFTELPTEHSHQLAISGLGGIGKTHVVVEYAYRFQEYYQAILWARADSYETLITSYTQFAHALDLPEKEEQDQKKIAVAVQRWLRTHTKWLLILDNVDDVALLYTFLPSQHQGHVLLTTHLHVTEPFAHTLVLENFSSEEGALLLLRRAKRLASNGVLDLIDAVEREIALKISATLDGFPLAIDQAGAYILETNCTLEDYILLYRQKYDLLLARRGNASSEHIDSVATTFSLAVEQARLKNPISVEFLWLCTFLAPDVIPESLIKQGSTYLSSTLQTAVSDPFVFNEIMEILQSLSLIQRYPNGKLLRLHRLVQAVLKTKLKEEDQKMWIERCIHILDYAFPPSRMIIGQWEWCEQLVPHVLTEDIYEALIGIFSLEKASLLHKTANYLFDRGQYSKAEILYQQTMALWEQILEANHPKLISLLNDFATLYREQGKYEQAEHLYRRALSMGEQILESDHSDLASSLHGLATLYLRQGKYNQAEPLYQRTIDIAEQTLGRKHPYVAHYLHDLAHLYEEQGKYEQAELLYQRTLDIWEQTLGPNYPPTAHSLHGLASIYRKRGKYEQAERLYQRALDIGEQALGPEHPNVAHSLHGLAYLYEEQGKYEQAELFYQRTRRIWEQAFGDAHPDLANPLHGLANIYQRQGKYEQAEAFHQRAFSIREQTLGPHHSYMIYSLHNLAHLYEEQGKHEQAESLYQRALNITEQAFGVEHSLIALSLHGLANVYREQGKYEQAESLYQRALTICEQRLSTQHPERSAILYDLAVHHYYQKHFIEAQFFCEEALEMRKQLYGLHHRTTQITLNYYIKILQELGQSNRVTLLEAQLTENMNTGE